MSILVRPVLYLAALVAFLFTAAPVQAQTSPDEILRHCLSHLRQTTDRAVSAIHERARSGGNELLRLDREGASDDELIASARASAAEIQRLAAAGHGAINTLAQRCVAALRDANASERHFAILREAVMAAHLQVDRAESRGLMYIRRVLHYVLNN